MEANHEIEACQPVSGRKERDGAHPARHIVGTFPGMPFGLGIWEILILAGVLVLLFGAKGAPGMARRLGTGVREMKDAVSEMDPRTVFDDKDEPAKPKPALGAAKPAAAKPEAVPAAAEPVAAPASTPASGDVVASEDEPPAS